MNLHIFDTSNYIYAGLSNNSWVTRGVRETNGEYESNSAPIGGVSFLISELSKYVNPNNVLMPVFDRAPIIKRKMYYDLYGDEYGYKGQRKAAPREIKIWKEYAEFILRDCGLCVQSAEDYEADDIIYTLVNMYKHDFSKIYIHTKDSDLYFLVDDNVEIAKVGTKGKVITMENYSMEASSVGGAFYNTCHLHKLYSGDMKSDNIPGVGNEWGPRIDSVIPMEDYRKLGDLDLCRKYIREAIKKYPNELNSHKLLPTFNLVCPLYVPYGLLDDTEQEINEDMLFKYYPHFDTSEDKWNLEDYLLDFIQSYYE